jgi:diguanylate cyclase (GGDEF)-like protein
MKILLAEDDAVSRRMVEAVLTRWGYEVISCSDGDEAWRVLSKEDAPRLAILDWMMPGLDGVDICRRLRSWKPSPYTYVILLTAKNTKHDVVEGLEVGADDYVTKPFNAHELRVRLRAGRRILELEESLLSLQEQLRDQATHDPLTGAWNHNSIIEILRKELSRSSRDGTKVGVVMADLDHFKFVNDSYGHLAGDAVLCETVQRIRESMRDYDEIGRYGGEEFLLVLSRCDQQSAIAICERIRASVAEKEMTTSEGPALVTMSLGLSLGSWDTRNPADLIRVADEALYNAKRNGRNRVELGIATRGDRADEATPPEFAAEVA